MASLLNMAIIFVILVVTMTSLPPAADARTHQCPNIEKRNDIPAGSIVFYTKGKLSAPILPNSNSGMNELPSLELGNTTTFWYIAEECQGCRPQLLYARTNNHTNNSLSLFRNFRTENFPYIFSIILRPFYDDNLETSVDKAMFEDYYTEKQVVDRKFLRTIENWEDPFCFIYDPQYIHFLVTQVVSSQLKNPPYPMAERLIRLKANRDRNSWICVQTSSPSPGELLEIGIYYGGDSASREPIVGAKMSVYKIKRSN